PSPRCCARRSRGSIRCRGRSSRRRGPGPARASVWATCATTSGRPPTRPSRSDHAVAPERLQLVGAETEQPLVDLLVVLAEPGGTARDITRGLREARVDTLHPYRAEDGVVDRHDVPPRRNVRVREDVGHRVGHSEGHLVSLEHVLDLPRRPLATPGRDDAVQLVAVLGAPGHRPEAWLAEQVLAPHRAGETGKEAVARRDDADVLAVLRRPVVEWRGVPEPVALALADDAEPVVGGERVLHDAEDRLVEGELDPLAAGRRSRHLRSSVSLVAR